MDINLLKRIIDCKSAAVLKNCFGLNINIYDDIDDIKRNILKQECKERDLCICETLEESVGCIISNITMDEEQQKFADLCNSLSLICYPLKNGKTILEQNIWN